MFFNRSSRKPLWTSRCESVNPAHNARINNPGSGEAYIDSASSQTVNEVTYLIPSCQVIPFSSNNNYKHPLSVLHSSRSQAISIARKIPLLLWLQHESGPTQKASFQSTRHVLLPSQATKQELSTFELVGRMVPGVLWKSRRELRNVTFVLGTRIWRGGVILVAKL